jgi:Tfp pilus assembly protein PilN
LIKINLVPVKEKKKRTELLVISSVAGVALIIVLAMGGYYLQKKKMLNDLEFEIAQIAEESKAYEEKIKEIKELEAKEGNLSSFKATIKSIAEVQRKVTVAVDQIALAAPEGVWLIELTQKQGVDSARFFVRFEVIQCPKRGLSRLWSPFKGREV